MMSFFFTNEMGLILPVHNDSFECFCRRPKCTGKIQMSYDFLTVLTLLMSGQEKIGQVENLHCSNNTGGEGIFKK